MADQQTPRKLSGFAKALNYQANQEEYLEARSTSWPGRPKYEYTMTAQSTQDPETGHGLRFDLLTMFVASFGVVTFTHSWIDGVILLAFLFFF